MTVVGLAVLLAGLALGQDAPRGSVPVPQGNAPLFRPAVPPYRFTFPRDHAAHPEFQTEWWYYTGHLKSGARRFGYQLTFFQVGVDPRRKASRSAWALHSFYFAHFTVTDENGRRFRFAEQVSRPALGMAGSETDRYRVWIHDWSAGLLPDGRTHHLEARAEDYALSLDLVSGKPPAIHGFDGVSQKSPGRGRASHYYSLTRLRTRGTLVLNGERLPVTGVSWMDHEFGSNQLTPDQAGWDWFSIQLDDGRELMLYVMRRIDGSFEPTSSGTLVARDGRARHLALREFRIEATGSWTSPASGGKYPAAWVVRLPAEGLEIRVEPTVPDQELVTGGPVGVRYWEGSVRIQGRDRSGPVQGAGYVELTGYAGGAPTL